MVSIAWHVSADRDFPNTEVPTSLFQQLIPRDEFYTVVAESDGRIIGSNVLWKNGEIAGVGPITLERAAHAGLTAPGAAPRQTTYGPAPRRAVPSLCRQ